MRALKDSIEDVFAANRGRAKTDIDLSLLESQNKIESFLFSPLQIEGAWTSSKRESEKTLSSRTGRSKAWHQNITTLVREYPIPVFYIHAFTAVIRLRHIFAGDHGEIVCKG